MWITNAGNLNIWSTVSTEKEEMLLHHHPVLNLKNPKWSHHKSGTVYINYTYVTGKHLIQQSQLLKKKKKKITVTS